MRGTGPEGGQGGARGHRPGGAERVASAIAASGGEAIFGYLDVSLYENAELIVKDIVRKYGRVDLIFNNAGIAIQGDTRGLTIDHWRKVLEVNLLGVSHGSIAAYKVMVKQGTGQIVNIGSLAGLIPTPEEIPYCTSKWGVVGFTNSLRLEGAELGARIPRPLPGRYYESPGRAARRILRGVEQNRAVIIFPFYARLVWWLYRLSPAALHIFFRRMVREFRRVRIVK